MDTNKYLELDENSDYEIDILVVLDATKICQLEEQAESNVRKEIYDKIFKFFYDANCNPIRKILIEDIKIEESDQVTLMEIENYDRLDFDYISYKNNEVIPNPLLN